MAHKSSDSKFKMNEIGGVAFSWQESQQVHSLHSPPRLNRKTKFVAASSP